MNAWEEVAEHRKKNGLPEDSYYTICSDFCKLNIINDGFYSNIDDTNIRIVISHYINDI